MLLLPMDRSNSHAGSPWGTLLVASCLALSCLGMGCGRTDSAPPVSDQEMEDLDLEFDMGIEGPSEPSDDVGEASGENP